VTRGVPNSVFTSWADYLEKVTWPELRSRCYAIADQANGAHRGLAAPPDRLALLTVWQVKSKSRGRCAYCGSLAVERKPLKVDKNGRRRWKRVGRRIGSLEHRKPRSLGGSNDVENLAWCCLLCNTSPRARLPGAVDHGGYYPDLADEPDPQQSEAVVLAKCAARQARACSIEKAFEVQARAFQPRSVRSYDDDDFIDYDPGDDDLFPDHECPQDTAMWRDAFG